LTAKTLHFIRFVGKRFYDANSRDAVFHPAVDIRNFAVHFIPGLVHFDVAVGDDGDQHGDHDKSDDSEKRIDLKHDRKGGDDRHDRDKKVFRAMVGKLANIEQVIGDPAHDVAGLHVVEKAERLFLHVFEKLLAHVGFNVDAELVSEISDDKLEDCAQHVHEQEQNADFDDHVPIAGWKQFIDKPLNGDGEKKFQNGNENRTGKIHEKQTFIGFVVGKKF